jgi:hypothetical protein
MFVIQLKPIADDVVTHHRYCNTSSKRNIFRGRQLDESTTQDVANPMWAYCADCSKIVWHLCTIIMTLPTSQVHLSRLILISWCTDPFQ